MTQTKGFMELFGKMTEKDMLVFLAVIQVTGLSHDNKEHALLLAKTLVKAHEQR